MSKTIQYLVQDFYNHGYNFTILNAKHFYTQLEHAILNNLPLIEVNIEYSPYQFTHIEFIKQFDKLELAESDAIYKRVVKYLEANKYKQTKERKIEIFTKWIYWTSLSNEKLWHSFKYADFDSNNQKPNPIECFMFKNLIDLAKSVLFEVENLNCCFGFQNESFKAQNAESKCVYDDMSRQPDILTRAICSRSEFTFNYLIENGLSVRELSYEHAKLKTPLHWAFFSNNLAFFHRLIQSGCVLDHQDDVFYNPAYIKDFNFAFYLTFSRKNKTVELRLDDDEIFLYSFNFYNLLSETEIAETFESLFKIGFDLNVKRKFINRYHKNGAHVELEFSQLLACFKQNGIKPSIIKYLIRLFEEQNGYEICQEELVKIVFNFLIYFYRNLYKYYKTNTRIKDISVIMHTLLPYLSEASVLNLNDLLDANKGLFG